MKNQKRMSPSHAGFTLIEILLVVGIMAMLAGVAGMVVNRQGEKARKQVTQVTLKNVKMALSEYEMDYGKYPASMDELVDPAKGPILDAEVVPTDEWKNALRFKKEKGRLHVMSSGADGAWGTQDDLRTP